MAYLCCCIIMSYTASSDLSTKVHRDCGYTIIEELLRTGGDWTSRICANDKANDRPLRADLFAVV